jgi:hypothetical protein
MARLFEGKEHLEAAQALRDKAKTQQPRALIAPGQAVFRRRFVL